MLLRDEDCHSRWPICIQYNDTLYVVMRKLFRCEGNSCTVVPSVFLLITCYVPLIKKSIIIGSSNLRRYGLFFCKNGVPYTRANLSQIGTRTLLKTRLRIPRIISAEYVVKTSIVSILYSFKETEISFYDYQFE